MGLMMPLRFGSVTPRFKATNQTPPQSRRADRPDCFVVACGQIEARDLGVIGNKISLKKFGISLGASTPTPDAPVPVPSIQIYGHVAFAYKNGLPMADWLTLVLNGEMRLDGVFTLFMALKGIWAGAMGIPPLNVANLWFTIKFDIALLPICPGPCGLRAIGLGGAVLLGQGFKYDHAKGVVCSLGAFKECGSQVQAGGYFDLKVPTQQWFDFEAKNIGVGAIGKILNLPQPILKFGDAVFPTFTIVKFAKSTMFGQIPDGCTGPFPECIQISPGFHFEAGASLWGIQAQVMASLMLPPTHMPPDFQCGFKLKVPDLVHLLMGSVRKYLPYGNEAMTGLVNLLGKFGIRIPKPFFQITNLELVKFSMVKVTPTSAR